MRDYRDIAGLILNRMLLSQPNPPVGVRPGGVLDQLALAIGHELAALERQVWALRDARLVETADIEGLSVLAREYTGTGRKGPVAAVGQGHFLRDIPGEALIVEAGQKVQAEGGMIYETLASAYFAPTDTESSDVPFRCTILGPDGNLAVSQAGTWKVVAPPAGVTGFVQTADALGGDVAETAEQVRARIRAWRSGFRSATPTGLKAVAYSTEYEGQRVAYAVYDDQAAILYVSDAAGLLDQRASVEALQVLVESALGNERELQLPHRAITPQSAITYLLATSPGSVPETQVIPCYLVHPWGVLRLADPPPQYWRVTVPVPYEYYTGLVAAVQDAIDGVTTDLGVVPAGSVIAVRPATRITVAISALVRVTGSSDARLESRLVRRIAQTVNGTPMGVALYPSSIVATVRAEPATVDCTVLLNGAEAPVIAAPHEIIRTDENNVSLEFVR